MPGDTRAEVLGAAPATVCPVCRSSASELVRARLPEEQQELVAANVPGWRSERGLCRDCLGRFVSGYEFLKARFPDFGQAGRAILPLQTRLGASDLYTGRGVTIAFLDSGFYLHPDLDPARVLAYVDVTNPRAKRKDLEKSDESSWHGMMTSVVAAGEGTLSKGLYRGLATDARLVLVKCGSMRRITHENLRRALEWVVRKRKRFQIRIVNVSCGGDYEASYLHDGLSQAAEHASREGLLVCAAVGNTGSLAQHPVLPPASAPSVLTVGGVDDKNLLAFTDYEMYHSSYGPTVDGLQKPEVVAPGIWIAAPILPGTATARQASFLTTLAAAPDGSMRETLIANRGADPELDAAAALDERRLRRLVRTRIAQSNLISADYKHVDGTSFAAPIVSSIAAQMIEANPRLTPSQLKLALMRTARRLPQVEVDRQGAGAVDARRAVEEALRLRTEKA